MAKLVVIDGPTVGLEYFLRGETLIGRHPRCQVQVSHREVSSQHAQIVTMEDEFILEDLGSRNGTLVNGKPIRRYTLRDGDEVRIGRSSFRFDAVTTPQRSRFRTTDGGSLTVELDATRDWLSKVESNSKGGGRLTRELRLLVDISRKIGTISGLKSTLDEIASTLLEVFPQCGRVMVLLSSDGVSLEPVVTRWRVEPRLPSSHYSETIVRNALKSKRAFLTVDAQADDRFAEAHSVVELRLRSVMCAPILHREHPLGVIELDTLETSRIFSEDDLNLLAGVVAQVAFAVANAQLYEDLRGLTAATVVSLTQALQFRSLELHGHSQRVSRLAVMMARRLEIPPDDLEEIRLAGLLHDIGFLGLPDVLLPRSRGQGKALEASELSADEWDLLRSHPERGAQLLEPVRPLSGVARLVLSHHERVDGTGYPRGLRGEDIPLGARILSIVDVFDAMTSPAYYRSACTMEEAFEAVRVGAGSSYDPALVPYFEDLLAARRRLEAKGR